ncbi:MAG: hypothetical protein EPN73_17910 [Paraburkholderia sp.]|uniref:hypothetical protein n=1 Tax=Paraburkholderia sp. TaxID=1926495 RepID=UPI0011F80FD1|nr:hypothetical protein [Paraburkholderia sp.]TAL94237.1 MAG: hypothetical protein EPN73_17910 [Paraburkholderia sp.]
MTYLRFSIFLLVSLPVGTFAQDEFSQNTTVTHGTKTYTLRCDDTTGLPLVNVTLKGTTADTMVSKQQLDEIDDCSRASWVTEKIGENNSSTLVLLNPGRSGANAQYNVFLLADESVSLAGYLPVSAEKVGDLEYRSYSSDAGSIWERTDTLQEGKFQVTNELQLIMSGSVCMSKGRGIIMQEPCRAKQVVARPRKPICIEYKDHAGKLLPNSACARLAEQM